MEKNHWVSIGPPKDWQSKARQSVKNRKKWEEEQIKQGKKEIMIPHPTLKNTFIVKYK